MKKLLLSSLLLIFAIAAIAQAPTTPSSNLSFNNIDGNLFQVSFTKGNGEKRLIIAKAGSPVTATPADGVDYISGDFGLGNEIAPGEFVVYEGIGNNNILIRGLNHTTTYYVKVFEFNGGASTTEYLTSSFLEGNQTTLTYPTIQASNITFSNIEGEKMTVSWTNGNGSGRILIAREGGPVDTEPVDLVNYGSSPTYGSYQIGFGNYVLYKSNGSSVNITNLKPNTTYHFALFEYNGSNGKVYLTSTSTTPTPGSTASQLTPTYPTINTATVYFDAPQVDYLRGRLSGYGNGARRIIVVKQGSQVDALPVDGLDYTPSTTFGSGSNLGNDNFVAYDGTAGNYLHLSGLQSGTTYFIKVFEYNGAGSSTAYLVGNDTNGNPPPEGSLTTLSHPTVQARDIVFSNVEGESMRVSWTNGDGSGRILVAREGSPVDVEPVDLVNYGSSPAYGSYQIGTGNYVLYRGTGSYVDIQNLTSNTTYYFALFEYNGSGSGAKLYLTSASPTPTPGATASQQTSAYPTINTSTVYFDAPQVDYLRTRVSGYGNGARRIIVVKKDSPVDALPVDGQDYSPSTTFGSGDDLGNGNYVVYNGAGGNYTHLSGLQPNTTYHVKVFEYNGTGSTTAYLIGNDANGNPPPEGSLSTLTSPTLQASNITFSNVLGEQMTVSWTKGNGAGRILVASEDRPVDLEPVDLVGYNSSAGGMGNASYQIGIGNYVLYNSTGTSVNITNLKPNTTYYFALFEFNGTGSSKLYLTSTSPVPMPGTTANQLTPAYPTINSTNVYFDAVDANSLRIRFPSGGYGNGARRLIVAKKGGAVDGQPVDGQEYTANSTFGSGDDLGNESFVVYNGAGGNYSYIYGIDYATTYYIKIFEYNGIGSETFYLRNNDVNGDPPAEVSESTTTFPTTQASNILFTNAVGDEMTLNWTNGTGSGRLLIAREGSPVDAEPVDLVNYSASSSGYGNASYEIGTGNYVLYSGTGSQVNITNLTPNRTYYFALFEYSGSSKKLYLTSTSPVPTPGATASRYLGSPPTANATNVSFRNIDGDSFGYDFTKGGGTNRIVVIREGSPVNADPIDEFSYLANPIFGEGADLGGGNYVIYNGSIRPSGGYAAYGLNHSTTYYLKVFEYNGTENETYYLTVSDLNNNPPAQGAQATITYPSTQASNIYFTEVSGSAMKVNWVRGDGDGRILIARKGSPVDVEPSDFERYGHSSSGMGNDSYEIGSGNYVLYNGSGNNVRLSDLELNSDYHFALFEYNGSSARLFLTSSSPIPSSGATANQSTTTYPSYAAKDISFDQIDGNRFTYSFKKGDGTHRIVIAKEGSTVDAIPIDGQEYTADGNFGAGQELGNDNYVVYNGTGFSSSISELYPSTTYYLRVFEYNKEGDQTYYLVSSYLEGNQNTLSPPTIQASDVVVSGKTSNSIELSWTEGNGNGSILIARADGPVDVEPNDLTTYSASRAGMGNSNYEIGNGNYVLFSGSISDYGLDGIDLINLLPNVNYHFAIFDFSGNYGKQYIRPAYTFQEQTWGLRPTVQASNAFLEDGATSMNVKFQSGDGLFTLVLGKVGSPVDVDPTDFTSYNSYGFIPEAEIGNGNYVLYDSKNGGNEFDLYNLSQSETYHFAFYEYAISESGELYLTPGYTASKSTSTPPTLLPTNLTVDPPCGNNIQVSWDINLQDPNTGDGRLVVLSKEPLNAVPMSTVDYTADFDYGEGSPIGNGFVVYKGSGVLFPPNLLEENTNYYINLFEYNGVDTDPAFNTTPVQGLIGDDTPPTVFCKNITVQLDINGVVSIQPEDVDNGTSDDCTLKTLSIDKLEFTCDDIGANTVTLTATDNYGNTSSCEAVVTVEDPIVPEVTIVEDKIESLDANCEFTIPDYTGEIIVTDNCTNTIPTITQNPVAGTVISGSGTVQEIVLTADDGNGNTATTSFNVTLSDNIAPTLTAVADQQEDTEANCSFTIPDYTSLTTAADNCAAEITITQSPVAGTVISGNGTVQEIVLTADDGDGNTATTSFNVSLSDKTAPTLTAVADLEQEIDEACSFTLPDYTSLTTAADNCATAVTVTQSPAAGTVISSSGTVQEIVLTADDGNGNIATTSFNITLSDKTAPTLTAVADQTEEIDEACSFAIPDYTSLTTAADNCATEITITQSPIVGTLISGNGTVQEIVLTADDGNGNINSIAFDVNLVDNIAPTIIGLSSDINVSNDPSSCGAAVTWTAPTFTDNCSTGSISQTAGLPSGSVFPVGVTTITYTATDDALNTYSESFNVIVIDDENPTLSSISDFDVNPDSQCEFTIPDYTNLTTVSDNCGIASISQLPAPGTVINGHGTKQTITLTAEDINGNTTISTFEITIQGTEIFYADTDGDGYGDADNSIISCAAPAGYVINSGDCDDSDASVNPGATEILYNGIDDDCDPATTDGIDADGDGYESDVDCNDNDAAINPGAVEVCDGIDNNCDGNIDEGVGISYYADADGDGYGDAANSIISCAAPAGYVINSGDCDDSDASVNPGATEILYNGIDDDCDPATTDGIDADGDGYESDVDCDDNDAAINPGAVEVCDGIDNNCDGNIDEGVGISYYADADGDGYGDAGNSIISCSAPIGYVLNSSDCDDTDAAVNPGATEILYNGIDDDCDPETADGIDADGDGFESNVDCNDNDAAINPGAVEVCDGIDNNCDGNIDEGVGISYYADADGDGYGDAGNSIISCSAPIGYVLNSSDCDDTDAAVNPGATEILYNGIDDDCDPETADGIDADGDGFESNVDCNDNDAAINPGAVEVCDGIDNNCDGNIDEGVGISYYADADGDGYGDAGNSIISCSAPIGYVLNSSDCDDTDAAVNPGATEILYNGIDDDCDPETADGIDADGDGFESNVDCNDNDATINPAAVEVCDGIDNNCDGNIDEGVGISYYADADGDGYGDAANSIISCAAPAGYVINSGDCDDSDASVNPGATEILYNGIDDDCDPATTDGIDADGDGYESDVDCDDNDAAINPGAVEICDGIDNNCDGNIDEGVGISYYADADGDGYGDAANSIISCAAPAGYVINSGDCDDSDASVNPGATEILYNGIDDDCDPATADGIDADSDGYESDVDCNDNDAAINPGAVEVCDGIDNNCDGNIDEGVGISYYADADGDGYGDAGNSIISCSAPIGYVLNSSDCDDTDAAVNPGATEILYNGIDDDCDPETADGIDADGDGFESNVDCNDNDAAINPGAVEVCDGIDNNCDGNIDEGVGISYYADADGDGYGDAGNSIISCSAPIGYVLDSSDCDDTDAAVNPGATEILYNGIDDDCDPETADGIDADGDGFESNVDCNDNDATINPAAVEVCDGIDNNCDGNIDEGVGISYYADADGDGYGDAGNSIISCSAPIGYVLNSSDCNDTDATVNPGATEILYNGIDDDCDPATADGIDADGDGFESNVDCNDNDATINPAAVEVCDGIDNNCDGNIDEGVGISYYADADGDGYGDAGNSIISCSAPIGYVLNSSDCDDTDAAVNPGATEILYNGIDDDCDPETADGIDADGDGFESNVDCNDNDATINPAAVEVCDGIDNNCDGNIDEGVGISYYADADGDGYGDAGNSIISCSAPIGYVLNSSDCNDTDATVNPGAAEILYNGIDDDCDPATADGIDADGDGFESNVDCNDNDAAINPGAVEVCDGIDNNCDGNIDEGVGISYYADADGDGYGDAGNSIISCSAPIGYVLNSSDCDDADANVNPGATEIPENGIDEDCDGIDGGDEGNCANSVSGYLNINPSKSSMNQFEMETPDGLITILDLSRKRSSYSYSGQASSIKIKVKGSGKNISVNGKQISLKPNLRYEFTGLLNVYLFNKKGKGKKSKSMGNWWIDISGEGICISPEVDCNPPSNPASRTVSTPLALENEKEPLIIDHSVNTYPNPFSKHINISFELLDDTYMTVNVFDLNSTLVSTLNATTLKKGMHNIKWNGISDSGNLVPNGVYVIQLKTHGYESMKKVLFIAE